MKKIIFYFSFILLSYQSFSQGKYNPSDYAKQPIWIMMMDDQQANYFEIQKAFDTYWAMHEKPVGESDMDVKQIEKNKKRFSKREIRIAREEARMRVQLKKYSVWLRKMEPYVKEDGSIMTPEERIKNSN